MKVDIEWLKDYSEIDVSSKELADRLTMTGSKVEGVETKGNDIKNVVVGKILDIKKHPDADKLIVTQVDIGTGKVQIVTGADNVKVGDRVVAANSAPCGKCFYCRKGEYNLCENLDLLNGAYAEYITVPARIVEKNLLKIPTGLSFEKAAFTEPLANVVHGVERTNIQPGDTVGVVGIGPIGLMFARLAKLKGAKVIAAGRNPLKLKLADEFAHADEIIDLKKYQHPEKIFKSFTEGGRGLDVAVECVGLPEVWEKMFSLVRRGGKVHLFGGCKSGTSVNIDTKLLHYDEVQIISVFHHTPQYFRQALDLIADGHVDVTKLITKKYPLSQAKDAILEHESGKAVKVLLTP